MSEKVVILSFSGRKDGNCRKTSKFILNYYGNGRVFCISDRFLPCGNCDYECLKSGVRCPGLQEAQIEVFEAVMDADIVYYVIPNYCGFPASSYFAFNERSVGYFDGDERLLDKYMTVKKRFVVISNSEENFAEALRQQTSLEPEVLYLKSSKYQKRSIDGDLMDSGDARQDLKAFLDVDRT